MNEEPLDRVISDMPEPSGEPANNVSDEPAQRAIPSVAPARPAPRPTGFRGLRTVNKVLVVILIVLLVFLLLFVTVKFLVPKILGDYDAPGKAASPSEAVQEYLEAVAAGDASTALLYSALQPTNDPVFFSDDFLKQSMAANPLTDIVVPDGQTTDSPAQIKATYTLGGQQVNAHFTVQKHGRDWLLDGGFLPLDLSALLDKGVPLSLGGIPLNDTTKVDLFPGVYTLASLNPMLGLTSPELRIEYPENNDMTFIVGFSLSADGASRIQQAAKAHLDECLTRQELNPEGCGFGFIGASSGTVDPQTITWTLAKDTNDIEAIELSLDGASLTSAVADTSIEVDFHALSTDKIHMYDATSSFTGVRADFTDPDAIQVTFGLFG